MSEEEKVYAAAGLDVDMSEAEQCTGSAPTPAFLAYPIAGEVASSIRADGFLVFVTENDSCAILGIALMGGGLHVRLTAQELRQSASGMLRAADILDGGRGKQ